MKKFKTLLPVLAAVLTTVLKAGFATEHTISTIIGGAAPSFSPTNLPTIPPTSIPAGPNVAPIEASFSCHNIPATVGTELFFIFATEDQLKLKRVSDLIAAYEKIVDGNYIVNLIRAQIEQNRTLA